MREVQRSDYLGRLDEVVGTPLVKTVTGIRRCGKSTLLRQFREQLLSNGVRPSHCININFEELENEPLRDFRSLHDHILKSAKGKGTHYVFIDEVQQVADFQKCLASLLAKGGFELFVTGSNAELLSGELATLLTGRTFTLSVNPFSFPEYAEAVGAGDAAAFNNYRAFGGFPLAVEMRERSEKAWRDYMRGVYSDILLRDVVTRHAVRDSVLLERIVRFLADDIGNPCSTLRMAQVISSAHGGGCSRATIDSYVGYLEECFIVREVRPFNLKGKAILRVPSKYYLADPGLRTFLLGGQLRDAGRLLENIVYVELLRRGYEVFTGRIGDREIDFVATKGEGDRRYFQVAESVGSDVDGPTLARELAPLKLTGDNYPKTILTLDPVSRSIDGIEQMNIIDWLYQKT